MGEDLYHEFIRYRNCGILLLLMNVFLAAIILLVFHEQKEFVPRKNFIYVMALYTFFIVASSIVSWIQYRNAKSPIISASKSINFASSFISLLSLEVTMLMEFGGKGN